jgi:hypothetical protein
MRETENELVWSLEKMIQSQSDSKKRKKPPCTAPGEEEVVAFEYLEQNFQGNAQAGMLYFVANMSGGQGKPSRNCDVDTSFKTYRDTDM